MRDNGVVWLTTVKRIGLPLRDRTHLMLGNACASWPQACEAIELILSVKNSIYIKARNEWLDICFYVNSSPIYSLKRPGTSTWI
jgi:hypothetical protein